MTMTTATTAAAASSSCSSSITEEIDAVRKNFPKIQIQSATLHFLTFSYYRTPYAGVKATLTFPEDYPSHALIPDVQLVPPGLKKKLERDVVKMIQEEGLAGTHVQVEAAVRRLTDFVDTNLFVPCWRELRQVVDLIQREEKSTLQISDATRGLLQLRLVGGKYHYACSIHVNRGYPSTATHHEWGQACQLSVRSTNFPPKIETMLTTQARELVRRMQDGMTSEDALRMSNPIAAPSSDNTALTQREGQSLTQGALKGLKHDIDTLAHVRDLREINAATKQGNATVKAHGARERKEARREIGKLTKHEITKDLEEQQQQWQREEQERMAGYNISEYDGSNPQPSLLSLVTFLRNKIQRLPAEKCPVCREYTLPRNPEELQALYHKNQQSDSSSDEKRRRRREARKKRPVRCYCGCWYHHACLDKFMTEPPFGDACPTPDCGRRVYHPEWPADLRELERAWANRQARQREIEDAAMFL